MGYLEILKDLENRKVNICKLDMASVIYSADNNITNEKLNEIVDTLYSVYLSVDGDISSDNVVDAFLETRRDISSFTYHDVYNCLDTIN